ncbi:hypothetical protein B0H19DRAFT_1117811 [Mycena capillaripes]|nr:hypothetical protein B0H19DRAFT_1117811 [Mycena capillaripes]
MKSENLRLRRRLYDIESQLLQIECPTNRRGSERLTQERQRRLVKEMTIIQESLDLIIYPILTLPVELTSEIFLHCLPNEPQQPSAREAPMLLTRICGEWRNIAHNDPRLWAALRINYRNSDYFDSLVQDWFLRARSMPFTLYFTLPRSRCSCQGCMPLHLLFDSWKYLTTFYVNGVDFEDLEFLAQAPRLVRFEFSGSFASLDSHPPLMLPNLMHLHFDVEFDEAFSHILDSLTLPGLQSLHLQCFCDGFEDASSVIALLNRAPNIESLAIISHDPEVYLSGIDFAPVLAAMPAITFLHLSTNSTDDIFEILHRLGELAGNFLPRIQTLSFSEPHWFPWEARFTGILVDALRSRCEAKSGVAQLLDFEFNFTLEGDEEVDDKITEWVSDLQKKGMMVQVGPKSARV